MNKSNPIVFIISLLILSILFGCSSSPAAQKVNTQAPAASSLPPTSVSTPTSLPTSTPIPTIPLNSLTDQAGEMCEKAFKSTLKKQAASAPLLTLVKNNYDTVISGQWRYNPSSEQIHPLTEAKSAEQVQTLVCVQESRTSAGSYDDGTGAYIINWKVRLVRWTDGQVVGEKSFVGGKPSQVKVHGGDGYGFTPRKEYREWLLNLFAGEAVFVQGVDVSRVAFSTDGKYLAVVGNDYSAKIWDIAQHKVVFTQAGKSNVIASLIPAVFSPDQQHLALGYLGGVSILTVGDWKKTADLKAIDIWNVAFSSDGSQMAAGLAWGYGGVKIYETASGNETKSYPMQSPVSQVIITPGDQYLIALVYSCTTCAATPEVGIFVWDFKSGAKLNNIKIPGVQAIALLKDGKTLAVAVTKNKDILLYDIQSGQPAGSMPGHADIVNLITQSSDGKWLASVDIKGTIHVWDQETRQIWRTSEGNGLISSLAFSADGNVLAVGSNGGTVELWKLQ